MALMTDYFEGYFDVRRFQKETPKEQQPLKSDNETITFDVVFMFICPDAFRTYAKKFLKIEYGGQQGKECYRVSFKIGTRTRWFDAAAQQIDRPSNKELDGKKYKCRMTYRQLDGDPTKMEARGYWVNDIQWCAADEANPFAASTPVVELPEVQQVEVKVDPNVKLPF